MCYKAPGPRCSAHVQKALIKAMTDYDKDSSYENYTNLEKQKQAYWTTPAGQRYLEKAIAKNPDSWNADRLRSNLQLGKVIRKDAIKAYHEAYPEQSPVDETKDAEYKSKFSVKKYLLPSDEQRTERYLLESSKK